MAKLKILNRPTRKKIIPLVMAIANSIVKELRFVEIINETVNWSKGHWNASPGTLAKMLIMSTFTDIRIPLSHLDDRLESIDVDFFLGSDDKNANVTSYNVGEALERIGEIDYNGIYETMALSAVRKYNMPVTRLHNDTTTISFYGDYDISKINLTDEEKDEYLRIERGYNKDGRPQSNQVVVGQIVNEYGIPLVSRTTDGATSDIEWNREAIQYASQIAAEGFTNGIFVADCKLVIEEHVREMNDPDKRISFVSRCPANFHEKLEHKMIEAAYQSGQWSTVGPFREGKNSTNYRSTSFIKEVYGTQMRLIVLESDTLMQKAELAFIKKKEKLTPIIKALEKKQWMCLADAEKEKTLFLSMKELALFNCIVTIHKRVNEKWPRGRRGANTKPKITESYHLRVDKLDKSEAAYQDFLHRQSCFVLISNVIDTYSDEDIIRTYKGQQVVENSFRMLKSPQLASVIYLKNPKRIEALSMILTFSLLVRALIQYRLRDGLKHFKEEHPGETIYAGWGGRPLENPTFKLLYEHSINCCFERESTAHYSFCWLSNVTKDRVAPLLMLMGLTLEQLLK